MINVDLLNTIKCSFEYASLWDSCTNLNKFQAFSITNFMKLFKIELLAFLFTQPVPYSWSSRIDSFHGALNRQPPPKREQILREVSQS